MEIVSKELLVKYREDKLLKKQKKKVWYVNSIFVAGGKIVGNVMELGLYESDYNWDQEELTKKVREKDQRENNGKTKRLNERISNKTFE